MQHGKFQRVLNKARGLEFTACRDPEAAYLALAAEAGAQSAELAYSVIATGYRALEKAHTPCTRLRQQLSQYLEQVCQAASPAAQGRRARSWAVRHEPSPFDKPRVLCFSDLHVDQHDNFEAITTISPTAFQGDVLIVAGDVADTFTGIRKALEVLRPKFSRVVFCAGNHDLWLRPKLPDALLYADSLVKLFAIWDLCDQLDVDVTPVQVVPGVVLLPLNSWYHYSFDTDHPHPGPYRYDSFCRWPVCELEAVWQLMLALNQPHLRTVMHHLSGAADPSKSLAATNPRQSQDHGSRSQACGQASFGGHHLPAGQHTGKVAAKSIIEQGGCHPHLPAVQRPPAQPPALTAATTVITASHFLPCRGLRWAGDAKSVGCLQLGQVLDSLGSHVHVHGHTHLPTDAFLPATCTPLCEREAAGHNGTRRHVHWPLLPGCKQLVCVWDTEKGTGARYAVDFVTAQVVTHSM